MAEKGSGKTYTSKGERHNVSRSTLSGVKRDRDPSEKVINVQRAWLEGRNPWVTLANPNKEQTNKRFVRVKANELWGHPKERIKKMYVMTGA